MREIDPIAQRQVEASLRRRVAETEVVASECDLYGHDYQVREWEADGRSLRIPASVFCSRCGKSWKVER